MKNTVNVLILLLMVLVSCKTKNNSIRAITSDVKKPELSDSSKPSGSLPDNYLLDDSEKQDGGPVYMFCEVMPEFPGGETAFSEYLKERIKYPKVAVSQKTEGRVVMKFIVGTTGKITGLKVLRSISKEMDEECLRVFKGMPDWKPGTINSKPVAVSFSIPVRFVLTKNENLNGIFVLP